MTELLASLLPAEVSATLAALLAGSAVLTAAVTTTLGLGGGVLLLALMSVVLPAPAVIPVHGVVQAASNGWRTAAFARHVRWAAVAPFAAGSVVGALAGSQVVVALPTAWLELVLATFVLVVTWLPVPLPLRPAPTATAAAGAATTLLTLFVGATGPVVAAYLRRLRLDRFVHVGTFAACMLIQHLCKIALFGLLGFGFAAWLPLLAVLVASSLLGTLLGRYLLGCLSNRIFHRVLRGLLTVIGLYLLAHALTQLGGA